MEKQKNKKVQTTPKDLFTQEERSSVPFIRALYKKMRNISKKLSDIKDLEAKSVDSLKPEQKDKISKKAGLLEELAKFENVLKIYKETMEGEKKDEPQSDLIVNLLVVGRYLSTAKHVDKHIATTEEVDTIKTLYSKIENDEGGNSNQHQLQNIAQTVRAYLKDEAALALVDRICKKKQFLEASVSGQLKITQPQVFFETPVIDSTHKVTQVILQLDEDPVHHTKTYTKTDMTIENNQVKVNVEQTVIEEIQTAEVLTENTPKVDIPKQQPEEKTQEIKAPRKLSGNPDKVRKYKGNQHRRRPDRKSSQIHDVEELVEGEHHQAKFTKEQKAELANDGFIFVEAKKQVPKQHYKKFGPERDNRQYHQ